MDLFVLALRQIVKEEGVKIFQEPLRFWSIAEDYTAGNNIEELSLLQELVQFSLLGTLEKIYGSNSQEERDRLLKQIRKQLLKQTQHGEQAVTLFLRKVCAAYEWNCYFDGTDSKRSFVAQAPIRNTPTNIAVGAISGQKTRECLTKKRSSGQDNRSLAPATVVSQFSPQKKRETTNLSQTKGGTIKLKGLLAAVGVLILILLSVLGVLRNSILDRTNSTDVITDQNSVYLGCAFQNISEGGYVVSDDEWTYYTNSQDNFKIYRIDNSGMKKEKLTDISVYYLNIKEDWLYFSRSDEDRYLYKMRTDGSDLEVLCDVASYEPKLVNDWIYYNNIDTDYSLWRIQLDGSQNEEVIDHKAYYCCYYDDHIFFLNASQDYLGYYTDMDGNDETCWNSQSCECLDLQDGILYYSLKNCGGIYALEAYEDASQSRTLTDVHNTSLNVNNGWIYFSNISDKNSLYKIDIQGGRMTKISNRYSRFINVENEWIYFMEEIEGEREFYKITINGENEQVIS